MGWGESQIQELRQELAFFAALVQRSSNPPRVRAGSSDARARASSDRETTPSFGKTRYRCAPTVRCDRNKARPRIPREERAHRLPPRRRAMGKVAACA